MLQRLLREHTGAFEQSRTLKSHHHDTPVNVIKVPYYCHQGVDMK